MRVPQALFEPIGAKWGEPIGRNPYSRDKIELTEFLSYQGSGISWPDDFEDKMATIHRHENVGLCIVDLAIAKHFIFTNSISKY